MEVTVVGCSGSMSGPCSASSCYLVQARDEDGRDWSIVLDLGSGALGALWRYCAPATVDAIVLSHLHADHMVDMIGLHVYRRWHPDGPFTPLPVLAPANAVERVRGVGGDSAEEDYAAEFTFLAHDPAAPVSIGPFLIESFEVWHPVPAYAVRITGPSSAGAERATLSYSGDTDLCDGVIEAARGTDLFLCEAAFKEGLDTVRGIHLTGRRAGQVAAAANPKAMVLTHIQPWTEPGDVLAESLDVWQGSTSVARCGAAFTI